MAEDGTHGWMEASLAYQAHRDTITGTVASLLDRANLPVHSVWIDMKELMQRAAAELAQANSEVLALREKNERLEQRIKALEAHEG
jgi:hypothetical protein